MMRDVQRCQQRFLVELMESASARGILRDDVDPKAMAAALTALGMDSNLLTLLGDDGPTAEASTMFQLVLVDLPFPPDHHPVRGDHQRRDATNTSHHRFGCKRPAGDRDVAVRGRNPDSGFVSPPVAAMVTKPDGASTHRLKSWPCFPNDTSPI